MNGQTPLHPFLVHFPIAFWMLGTAVLCAAWLAKKPNWRNHGWFLLMTGAVCVLPAVLAGQRDFSLLADTGHILLERHRDLGNLLPWLMVSVVLLKLHTSFRRNSTPWPDGAWVFLCVMICAILMYTGWLGGTLVYSWLLTS